MKLRMMQIIKLDEFVVENFGYVKSVMQIQFQKISKIKSVTKIIKNICLLEDTKLSSTQSNQLPETSLI